MRRMARTVSGLFLAVLVMGAVAVAAPEGAHGDGGHDASKEPVTTFGEAAPGAMEHDVKNAHGGGEGAHGKDAHGDGHGKDGHGEAKESKSAFDPHAGSWFNPIARAIFGLDKPHRHDEGSEAHFTNVKYDFIVIAFFLMGLLAFLAVRAAKNARVRPEGKPASLANVFESMLEGYRNYLVGVMGEHLAYKYGALITSFFFTILLFNYTGLIPGMIAPTANPTIPLSMALVGFVLVHIIAIKETGFKSWFMHFVGEPKWMAPLMFPLHIVGELVKPVSLTLRLVGNVFGEEVVIAKLIGLAIAAGAAFGLPTFIPFQVPILFLSLLFGLLQAVVFSTLLAIYIATLSTHHDEHDEHNAHGSVEHTHVGGHHQVVAHPSEATLA
jgi:F-type H+-transporting ATPase subunit a